ncbi:MAG: response regulator transcription factor [Planctomycetota bacterium]|nr:response regulator transcription factor [Planctomycetota bacterium]
MSISVLIADDHEVVRTGLAVILRDEADIEIIADVSTGQEAVDMAIELRPDVVLMDVRMGETDGLDAVDAIHDQLPDLPIVMHSMSNNPTYVARSIALGAWDYVLKGSPVHELMAAIRRAAHGESPPKESLIQTVRAAMSENRGKCDACPELTRREIQVLRHLALGLSNREIGRSMDISLETVKEHVQNVLRKTNATDRTQAAVWAVRAGMGA